MQKIKITHINPTDIKGGAALAGYRLHKDFLNFTEIDSINFVDEKYTQDKEVIKFSIFFLRQIERVLNKIGYFTGLQYMFSVNWIPLVFNKRFRQTDVFIIRNVHGGLLPLWFPYFLSKFAPVIWRLPDMWSFTGHCVYSYDCERWKIGCGQCPILKDYPALFFDTTRLLFKIKKYFYNKSNLFIVTPSQWMLSHIEQSPILDKFQKFCIPPGVDVDFYGIADKNSKPTLIFVSASLKDKRKGGFAIFQILKVLNEKLIEKNIFVDVYWAGQKDLDLPVYTNISNIFLGRLDPQQMKEYYQKSHLHILPTLADNLPNTLLESMACGTPAVVFDVGGCKEAVRHNVTGYLAKPFLANDFVEGIMSLLTDQTKLRIMSGECRKVIENNFTVRKQSIRYLDLIKNFVIKI